MSYLLRDSGCMGNNQLSRSWDNQCPTLPGKVAGMETKQLVLALFAPEPARVYLDFPLPHDAAPSKPLDLAKVRAALAATRARQNRFRRLGVR